MTRMKDSGIKWIGEVPEEWGIKKLSQFFSEHKLKNLGNIEQNLLSLSYGKIVRKSIKSSVGLLPESFETYNIIDSNDIVLRLTDLQNDKRSLRTGLANERGIITSAYLTIRLIDGNDSAKYYHYLLHSYDKCKVFYNFGGGVRQGGTWDDLSVLKMIAPPKDEQTKIADFLDKKVAQLDEVKSLLEEQIKTLEDYRQSLIYETVTKGLDKTVPLKDSGVDWIGQIPEGWGVGKLKYYFDVQLGKMLQPSAINGNDIEIDYLRAINVQWDNISVDNLSKMWCNPSEVSKYEIMNGDLLVCEGGEVGRCGIVEYLSDRAIIQNAVHRIRSAERANVRFLNYYIQHTTKSKWFDILCNKATIAHLTSEKLLNTLVVLPSISEQIQIADFLDKKTEQINQMIAIKKEQIENINKQRQTLIYDVVTGKRRI
ncbi:MAG: restriction endonuclease subunit S [Streptococcus suis]